MNVFPITAPPLRERQEDIPVLVRYFAQKCARPMNKSIETIPADAMTTLIRYSWPGNVRELENFIERAVILSQWSHLEIPVGELNASKDVGTGSIATLEVAERDHIERALWKANWVFGGPSGAATRLGMNGQPPNRK